MQSEPLARALLHLAVCVGRLDLQEAAMELLAPKPVQEKGGESTEGSRSEQQKAKQPPSKGSRNDGVSFLWGREGGVTNFTHVFFNILCFSLLSAVAYGKNLKKIMRICVINDNNG